MFDSDAPNTNIFETYLIYKVLVIDLDQFVQFDRKHMREQSHTNFHSKGFDQSLMVFKFQILYIKRDDIDWSNT